jgi:hypothetical protein
VWQFTAYFHRDVKACGPLRRAQLHGVSYVKFSLLMGANENLTGFSVQNSVNKLLGCAKNPKCSFRNNVCFHDAVQGQVKRRLSVRILVYWYVHDDRTIILHELSYTIPESCIAITGPHDYMKVGNFSTSWALLVLFFLTLSLAIRITQIL